ncbi:MAG: winged helix-turn-helix transcriptional regulator [Rhodospirillales bacterium]|nr:winged helix-turn-helix transcriptional regulator [Rhodospirillales bacterium]MBO6785820.1 winged helix-turn-helix transcriptional regulator [Rhodospirillales bacterium]
MYFFTMTMPDETTEAAWTKLMRAQDRALSHVEAALKDAGFPPLAWYDVLLEVERAGKSGIRAIDLQQKLLLPQYGISRLLSKIEAAGYISRQLSAEDGRSQEIVITATGRQLRRRMWAVYGPAIEQAVGCKLTPSERKTLTGLLEKLTSPPADT